MLSFTCLLPKVTVALTSRPSFGFFFRFGTLHKSKPIMYFLLYVTFYSPLCFWGSLVSFHVVLRVFILVGVLYFSVWVCCSLSVLLKGLGCFRFGTGTSLVYVLQVVLDVPATFWIFTLEWNYNVTCKSSALIFMFLPISTPTSNT